jgi:hypothetical protein
MMRSLIGPAAVLFVVAGTAGCTEPAAPESLGHIAVPLTAPGSGGATYRLPPNTLLLLSSGGFFGSFSLDDDAPSLTVDVPPGDYSVFLSDSDGDTTIWPLRRQNADGTVDIVPGTLDLTSMITVTKDHTTSLVIRFHVAGIVPITFSLGSVDVTVVVDETPASFDFEFEAPALTVASAVFSATAPAVLASRLPATGSMGDRYVLHAQTTSPWSILQPDVVCAQVSLSVEAGGNQGFIDMLTEAPASGNEQLCIFQGQSTFAQIFTTVFHDGPATTPLLSDLGDHPYFIGHSLDAFLEANVFDGKTLHLDVLAGTHSAPMHLFAEIVAEIPDANGAITFDPWYQYNANGAGTTTLTAR